MGVRTVCFLAGVVLVMQPMPWPILGWLMFVGAVFLPYIAVVIANAGVRKKGAGPSPFGAEPGRQIDGPQQPPADTPPNTHG